MNGEGLQQRRTVKLLTGLCLIHCLLALPSVSGATFRHEIGLKPFYIPERMETGRSGDGSGYIFDYEYRFHKYFGVSVGYLTAEYDDNYQSPPIYTVTGTRPGTLYKEEVSLKGLMIGLRFRSPYVRDDRELLYALVAGNIGFLKRDGKETHPKVIERSEDVNVFCVSLGIGMPIKRLDLSGGIDIGGITGRDGGEFATLFMRIACRF